jgi:RNA polymerase sigma-70 factor (ECF subfamily)
MNKEMLNRIREGDEGAFNKLYTLFKEPAIRFCNSIIKDIDESENLIQEVFIKIWDKRLGINPELNFNSYLFTIIRNRVFDYLKEVKKNEFVKERYWQNIVDYQRSEPELKEERISKIKKALGELTEKRRKIIQLNYEEGKSYEEIATLMNISKNTVKNQLVKAKQIIRAQMKIASL